MILIHSDAGKVNDISAPFLHPVDTIEPEVDHPPAIATPSGPISTAEGVEIIGALMRFLVPPRKGRLRWTIAKHRLAALAHGLMPEVGLETQSAIAEELGITRSAFSEICGTLERFTPLGGIKHSNEVRERYRLTQKACWVDGRRARKREAAIKLAEHQPE